MKMAHFLPGKRLPNVEFNTYFSCNVLPVRDNQESKISEIINLKSFKNEIQFRSSGWEVKRRRHNSYHEPPTNNHRTI